MIIRRLRHLIFCVSLLCSNLADAFEVPSFSPNVVDQTNTLSGSEIQQLNSQIEKIRGESDIFAAIFIVKTLDGDSVDAAAEKTFRVWELGKKGNDNGLLILVALADHRMRVEVGYGLEGLIPDIRAKQIVDSVLAPRFRENRYATGLSEALEAASKISRLDAIKLGPRT